MASNPILQAVLRFQHHQTTTPYEPIGAVTPLTSDPPPASEVPGEQPVNPSYMPGAPEEHPDQTTKEEE